MTTSQIVQSDFNDVLTEMERPEVQESLTYLLQKLPDIQKAVASIDTAVQFGREVLADKQTVQAVEDKLSLKQISPESFEALLKLFEKLPILLELIEQLETATEFIKNVMNDKESLAQINESLNDLPIFDKANEIIQLGSEIKQKAESQPMQNITIFTLMKWIKNPSVQKGLHYVKSTIDVLEQKS